MTNFGPFIKTASTGSSHRTHTVTMPVRFGQNYSFSFTPQDDISPHLCYIV